jgi:hypothetical protein
MNKSNITKSNTTKSNTTKSNIKRSKKSFSFKINNKKKEKDAYCLGKCIMKNGMTEHWNFCTTDDKKYGDTVVYFVDGLGCSEKYSNFNKETNTLYKENTVKYFAGLLDIDCNQVNYICRKYFTALSSVIKTTMKIKPITRHNLKYRSDNNRFIIDFLNKIVKDSKVYKNILLYGHSYGGALLNRLSEKLNKLVDESNESDFSKIKIATFDSIYVAKFYSINKINIKNYMAVNDVALISNKLKSFDFSSEFSEKNYKELHYGLFGYYKKQMNNNKEIYWFCIKNNDGNFSCKEDTTPYIGAISIKNWKYHIKNYNIILDLLMSEHTNELEGYYDEEDVFETPVGLR